MMGARKLGIMISAGPGEVAFDRGLSLAEAGLRAGCVVYLYCIDAAVAGLRDGRFKNLRGAGVHLFACAYSLQQRDLSEDGGATLSGLTILSDLIASTDRFASFN